MPAQQLLLSWKDHNGAIVSVFENLLKKNSLVDCTLAAEGQYLKAHKVVLSACSAYFELLFNQESEKNPIVILKDVKFVELEAAVNFMYRGEVEVCEDRLGAFLEVADALQIKGLGSDGRFQTTRNRSEPTAKSTKTISASAQQHSRRGAHSPSENTGESLNTTEVDLTSNHESSSRNQQSHREASNSSPSLAIGSSFSMASTSGSGRPGSRGNLESSSPSSRFPSGETVPTDINTVIKTEPVTDPYLEEKSDETERDFDDVTMMEDQEDWDEPNPESMGDDEVANAQEQGYIDATMKTEHSTSENVAPAQTTDLPTSDGAAVIHSDRPVAPERAKAAQDREDDQADGDGEDEEGPPRDGQELDSGGGAQREEGQDGELQVEGPDEDGGGVGGGRQQRRPRPRPRQRRKRASLSFPPEQRSPAANEPAHSSAKRSRATAAAPDKPHDGPKTFKCLMCAEELATAPLLREHYATHTEVRPFKCEECAYAAMQASDLKKHQRIHTGERPYTCAECGLSFTQSNSLKVHERIHTGDRPYKCADCDKAFTAKSHLITHRRKHHDHDTSDIMLL